MGDIADYHVEQFASGNWGMPTNKKYKNQGRDSIMAVTNTDTKVITGKVRLSFANIWEPKSINGGDTKYSSSILIPKADKTTMKKIKAAVEAAKELGKNEKWGGKIPKNIHTPVRDGDDEADEKGEAYEGHYFLNASSKNKPGIVDRNREEIIDTTEVYSGCYVRVSISFYPFDTNGNKGVAVGLNNIQKWEDGDFLGGRSRAEDDFDDLEGDDTDDDDDFLG